MNSLAFAEKMRPIPRLLYIFSWWSIERVNCRVPQWPRFVPLFILLLTNGLLKVLSASAFHRWRQSGGPTLTLQQPYFLYECLEVVGKLESLFKANQISLSNVIPLYNCPAAREKYKTTWEFYREFRLTLQPFQRGETIVCISTTLKHICWPHH